MSVTPLRPPTPAALSFEAWFASDDSAAVRQLIAGRMSSEVIAKLAYRTGYIQGREAGSLQALETFKRIARETTP